MYHESRCVPCKVINIEHSVHIILVKWLSTPSPGEQWEIIVSREILMWHIFESTIWSPGLHKCSKFEMAEVQTLVYHFRSKRYSSTLHEPEKLRGPLTSFWSLQPHLTLTAHSAKRKLKLKADHEICSAALKANKWTFDITFVWYILYYTYIQYTVPKDEERNSMLKFCKTFSYKYFFYSPGS